MSSGVRIASTPCEGVEVRLDVRPLVCPQTVVAVLPCKRAVPRPSGKARLPPSRVDVVLPVVLCEQAARLPLGWKAGRKPVGAPSWVGLEPGENVLLCASGKPSTGLGEAHGNADNEGKQSLTLTVPVPRTVAALNATTFRLAAAPPQAKNGESSCPTSGAQRVGEPTILTINAGGAPEGQRAGLPPEAVPLADGLISLPVTSLLLPERLVVSDVRSSRQQSRDGAGSVVVTVRVADTRGLVVSGATVKLFSLPAGLFEPEPHDRTDLRGLVRFRLEPRSRRSPTRTWRR